MKEIQINVSEEKLLPVMNEIAIQLLRTIKRRVHSDGLDIYESSIGTYSTQPMYANPRTGATLIGLPNAGKTGRTKFNNGKDHKTRYYSDGYKGWRRANRRKTDKVDLYFKGDLDRSFTFQRVNAKWFTLGFSNSENWNKARGLEQHFSKNIWGIGQREEKIIDLILKNV
jgi:hypothetical protein